MPRWLAPPSPRLLLGTHARSFPLFPTRLLLDGRALAAHRHVIGVSGSGKSKLLESLFAQLLEQRVGVSFLDPHADSAEALLRLLCARGFFRRPDAYDRLLYIDFADPDYYLPFNVLARGAGAVDPHTIAGNVLEAFHRAWPALGDGAAPQFDNLVLAGTLVLIENDLPITRLHGLLTDKPFRDGLLGKVTDGDVVAFFQDRFDRWSRSEAPQLIESTLRRVFLLTFSPLLKAALGDPESRLDFRRILDAGTSVIFNLGGVHDQDARRLLGCLITIGYESAALSRTDLLPSERRQHHLLLDEFSDYSAQSEEALSRMLSLVRKFGLSATMAHQTWSQASARLQGALQNVGVEIALRVGRQDAELLAKGFGSVDPYTVKKAAASATGQPIFLELGAQWEQWARALADQPPRSAFVRVAGGGTVQIRTPTVPDSTVSPAEVERVKREYRRRLLRSRAASAATPAAPRRTVRLVREAA